MSINLSSIPSMPSVDVSSLPNPSEISEAVGDAVGVAVETAGDAAIIVAKSARRRPKVTAVVVGGALAALLCAMIMARRRRTSTPLVATAERPRDIAAA